MADLKTDVNNSELTNGSGLMNNRYLVFSVNNQNFALDLSHIIEIVEILPITKIPNMPECIKGIMNLRGTVVPVMDLRMRFGFSETEYTERTCIVVIQNNNSLVGLIVEEVEDVLTIEKEEMSSPSNLNNNHIVKYIQSIGMANNAAQSILDCDMLFDLIS